jgi:hypothetical protein
MQLKQPCSPALLSETSVEFIVLHIKAFLRTAAKNIHAKAEKKLLQKGLRQMIWQMIRHAKRVQNAKKCKEYQTWLAQERSKKLGEIVRLKRNPWMK